jgi:putative acyl-CoA dehydrogenase
MSETHQVLNQPPALVGYDAYAQDVALREGVRREGAGWAEPALAALGKRAGTEEAQAWGAQANENPPLLRTHDRFGHRIDGVEYHPAYHQLMTVAVEAGLGAFPGRGAPPGSHLARAAGFLIWSHVESGHGCPISMTYAAVPALRVQPDLSAQWEPKLTARVYQPGLLPMAQKAGALCGMAMTEKQGGSDVRANTTRAAPVGKGGPGAEYLLTGHKWFCSAPMCDVFLMLAQAPGGLSCFLVPRVLPDGTRNGLRLQRLKDKLGNRSNASSELELHGAHAHLVGEEGRGVRTIIEMVNFTRLDCVGGSAGLMRQALVYALHHARHRSAFGKRLYDQPLMRNVLSDLALESEAATQIMVRLAVACDRADADPAQAHFKRLALAVSKYLVCKRTPVQVGEALECLGGNGYVEESGMPRLYREAPLNSIWEGSGNVNALDTLRAAARQPESVGIVLDEVRAVRGSNAHLDRAVKALEGELSDLEGVETRARRLVERLALVLAASLLVRHSPPAVAEAYCASRLGGDWGSTLGTLPATVDFESILQRALPA